MKQSKEYCTIDPDYPQTGYFVGVFIGSTDGLILCPLRRLMLDLDDAQAQISRLAKETAKRDDDVEIIEYASLVRLDLASKYKLEPRFWENPTMEYDTVERINVFSKMLLLPEMHQMLVTPSLFQDDIKEWLFEAAFPYKMGTDQKTLENFMVTSKLVVDERAQYAAIYDCVESKSFKWDTKEILDVFDPSSIARDGRYAN